MTDTLQRRQGAPASQAPPEPLAEAFTFVAAPASSAPGPTVVVKRRKTKEHAQTTPAPQEPSDRERVPRVFRVASALQDANATSADAQGAAPDPVGAPARTRRRRRALRLPVTIIRPGEDLDATIAEPSRLPDAAVEPGLRFGQAPGDHRRYVELQIAIEALRREAETLRKAEAAVAVRWIRKAITRYGLAATDLGF
jgi:hypothetical protein